LAHACTFEIARMTSAIFAATVNRIPGKPLKLLIYLRLRKQSRDCMTSRLNRMPRDP
jgi:hypothetical protein